MRIGTQTPVIQAKVATPQVATPAAATAAPEAKDTVTTSQPSDAGQMAKMAVTGLGGLALAIPCTYAGLAGGAVVGGLLGGAIGPITGSLTSNGMWGAISSAWSTAGTVGQIGLALGGATALAGSFALSSKIGSVFVKDNEPKAPINWKNPVNAIGGTVLLTAGIAAGTVGGLALAGGAAAAGTLVNGLIHHGFTAAAMSGLGHNALVAAGVGGAVGGLVGMTGGASLTTGAARHVVDPATKFVTGLFHKEPAKA